MRRIFNTVKYVLLSLALVGATLLGVRAFDASKFPDLQPWHKYVPQELPRAELAQATWVDYQKAEDRIFAAVREKVTLQLPAAVAVPSNRYYENGPLYPGRFAQDWNRSYVLEPAGKPVGAVVFLHGLTDSPYSLRHIARRYTQRGFVSIAIRLPAHGTVPGALTRVQWEDWSAATRLAVREARRRTDPSAPLHLVGFSNGGALAMKYALDALEDKELARPDRIVLVSPMIGITRFARFARLAGLPAVLPSFAKAAWLSVVPEFNPFKYNSFPVNGARQSYRLTRALQQQIEDLSQAGRLTELPPVITFQSVLDFTVSTPAILSALYAHLPDNGSEIVLFDVNRTIKFGPLLRASSDNALARLMPKSPQTVPLHRHRQCLAGQHRDRRKDDRTEPVRRTDSAAGAALPGRDFFPVPCGGAVSAERPAVRPATRSQRRRTVRRQPGHAVGTRRARSAHRRRRLSLSHRVQSILSIHARTHRTGNHGIQGARLQADGAALRPQAARCRSGGDVSGRSRNVAGRPLSREPHGWTRGTAT